MGIVDFGATKDLLISATVIASDDEDTPILQRCGGKPVPSCLHRSGLGEFASGGVVQLRRLQYARGIKELSPGNKYLTALAQGDRYTDPGERRRSGRTEGPRRRIVEQGVTRPVLRDHQHPSRGKQHRCGRGEARERGSGRAEGPSLRVVQFSWAISVANDQDLPVG